MAAAATVTAPTCCGQCALRPGARSATINSIAPMRTWLADSWALARHCASGPPMLPRAMMTTRRPSVSVRSAPRSGAPLVVPVVLPVPVVERAPSLSGLRTCSAAARSALSPIAASLVGARPTAATRCAVPSTPLAHACYVPHPDDRQMSSLMAPDDCQMSSLMAPDDRQMSSLMAPDDLPMDPDDLPMAQQRPCDCVIAWLCRRTSTCSAQCHDAHRHHLPPPPTSFGDFRFPFPVGGEATSLSASVRCSSAPSAAACSSSSCVAPSCAVPLSASLV